MQNIKKYWALILVGLILRLVIASVTYHPDIKSQVLASSTYLSGRLDPYEDAPNLSSGAALDKLPLSYFLDLPFHFLARPLVIGNTENIFFQDASRLFGTMEFWLYLIYVKLPMILFDLALGFVLVLLVAPRFQKKILYLWIFNPVTLWATTAVGQIDVYATFFMVLALLFIKKEKFYLAALAIGLGGAVKTAPFLLLPLLLWMVKGYDKKIIAFVISLIPLFLTVVPYLSSSHFRQDALFAPQMQKTLFAQISLSGGESIFIFIFALIFLYFIYFSKERFLDDFIKFSVAILLATLALTHFHIQWFLWVMPFLLIWLMDHWKIDVKWAVFGLGSALLVMLFLFEASLQFKLFAPLLPTLDQAVGLKEILSDPQAIYLRSLSASVFAASSGFLIWRMLRQ